MDPALAGHVGVDQRLLCLREVDPRLDVLEPVEELCGDREDRRDQEAVGEVDDDRRCRVEQQRREREPGQHRDHLRGQEPEEPEEREVPVGVTVGHRVDGVHDERRSGGDQADEQGEDQPGHQLRRDDATAMGLQGEGDHGGALAPLAGDQHDAEHREQEAGDEVGDRDEVLQLDRLVLHEHDDERDHHDRRGQERRDPEQPGAGTSVVGLAELDADQRGEGDPRCAGDVQGRGGLGGGTHTCAPSLVTDSRASPEVSWRNISSSPAPSARRRSIRTTPAAAAARPTSICSASDLNPPSPDGVASMPAAASAC